MIESDADTVQECETQAGFFGRAFQTGEFDDVVGMFEPGAAEEFVASLKKGELGTVLSDDPRFVLRRRRRAIEALYENIESTTISETTETNKRIVVTGTFHCEDGVAEFELVFNQDDEITDLVFPDSYSPPSYVDTVVFDEYPVTIDCGDISLDGVVRAV
ncbi:hypothetical protein ACLI4Q_20325 [Natrialbaceae archaeon A-CW1-1]